MVFSDDIKAVAGNFRSGQKRVSSVPSSSIPNKKKKTERISPQRQRFNNLFRAGRFEEFNSVDLVYYFAERSKESEKFQTYPIANFKRDAGVMKFLLQTYSAEEVAGMIDFVFSGANPKIERPTLNMFRSGFVNTIYRDYKNWVDGVYAPTKKGVETKKLLKKREYTRKSSSAQVITDWDELEG